ncbi:MAG: hypothetical protein K0R54_2848 [Clostridiaceae bacterium]|jgi:hypothetical protein|nr:hypothetical protein [Clostridiaceae bacterium]
MFPQCYFNYMNQYFRTPIWPGGVMPPSGPMMPGTSQMPVPGVQQPATPSPENFEVAPGSPTQLDTQYTQGYLKTQIGKKVNVTFLIGTNQTQDRNGILEAVGISYLIIRDPETRVKILCDLYSVKFVNIID